MLPLRRGPRPLPLGADGRPLTTAADFYAAAPARRELPERWFGGPWKGTGWGVFWLPGTEELCLLRGRFDHSGSDPDAGTALVDLVQAVGAAACDIVALLLPEPKDRWLVEVLGVLDGPSLDTVMDGWQEASQRKDGIPWLRARVRAALAGDD